MIFQEARNAQINGKKLKMIYPYWVWFWVLLCDDIKTWRQNEK